ncbi:MAG: ECF transporter S component [Clostridia bacterium]|nr:ECF transporter S component [Clostridia bacterium]
MTGKQLSRRIAVLAVLIGLSTLGRFLFAWLPGFKPLGAVAILAGMYMGWRAGFLVGALSIVVSNFYFGHGPWTLFQIAALGLIGLLAGVLGPILRRNRWIAAFYGVIAAILFSGIMDLWTAIWMDHGFVFKRYLALTVAAGPFTLIYACSNVLFLLILMKPVGKMLTRMKVKYGV